MHREVFVGRDDRYLTVGEMPGVTVEQARLFTDPTRAEDFLDIASVNFYALALAAGRGPAEIVSSLRPLARDNARTPMQWDDSPEAGFTTGRPWMAVNPNHTSINAKAALADADSVFQHYRRLIQLRHTEPAVACGDFTMLLGDHDQIYAFTRRLDNVELLVLCNVSGRTAMADQVPDAGLWENAELLLTNAPPPEPSQHRLFLKP